MSAIKELDVMRALPDESALALDRFITINPSYKGADWSDCLSVLCDSDSNLEVSEPLWEELDAEGFIDDLRRPYITPVILTLYYADPSELPLAIQVRIATNMVLAYLGLIEGEWQQ